MLAGSGTPLSSSLTAPVSVTTGFSVTVREDNYSDTFSAKIVSWTAAASAPCYTTSSGSATVFTFTPVASPALNGSGPSPCGANAKDIEGVRFTDARGNATTQYFATGISTVSPSTASGIVVATLPGTSTPLASSPVTPIAVTNSFSIAVQEAGYTGAFTASIISYTAPTTAPCYAVSGTASTVQPSVFTFTPQNSPSVNGTTGTCALSGDIEGVRFSDSNGNSTIQYFKSPSASVATTVTVNRIDLSIIGSPPTSGVCGTYQLKVQAYDQSGAAITTAVTYTYPITVSIAGANNTAVISTTGPGAQTACSSPPNAATTLAIATSPTPVYVFVNGLQANNATTLTATAFGVPAGNIGQLTF
jgi:hypothetical protein